MVRNMICTERTNTESDDSFNLFYFSVQIRQSDEEFNKRGNSGGEIESIDLVHNRQWDAAKGFLFMYEIEKRKYEFLR